MDADRTRTPSLRQRCWVDGKQPSGKTKDLYDSAVQKLLDELGRSLLEAPNKSQWHNITRPEALAAQARAASRLTAQVAAQTALCCHQRRCIIHITRSSWRLGNVATCKPESRRSMSVSMKPTNPAGQISDADRRRQILITDNLKMHHGPQEN